MRLSAHLGASRISVILKPLCLGCKGSWVQIPPRRPFNSITYTQKGASGVSSFLPKSTYEAIEALGANSAHRIPSHIYRFGDSTAHETSLSESHFLTSFKNRKSISQNQNTVGGSLNRGIAWNAHENKTSLI